MTCDLALGSLLEEGSQDKLLERAAAPTRPPRPPRPRPALGKGPASLPATRVTGSACMRSRGRSKLGVWTAVGDRHTPAKNPEVQQVPQQGLFTYGKRRM